MRRISTLFLSIMLISIPATASIAVAQAQTPSQTNTRPPVAGVDRTTLGVYRALAQIAYEFNRKGDNANAAKVAFTLMLVWSGQDDKLQQKLSSWETVDKAMDAFAKPLVVYDKTPLNQDVVELKYHQYLDELQKEDMPW